MTQLEQLIPNLPIPEDDGACRHLSGMKLPDIRLPATHGQYINLSMFYGLTVVYIYPMTGHPDRPLPAGWNNIPGARGCTPQACAFRDHHDGIRKLGARVFGLSTQHSEDQQEAVKRLHLPFSLLSDYEMAFSKALSLLKRITLICRDGVIEKVFYPVFPPDKNAEQVVSYLQKV
jgi:peroxiredoxin